MIILWNQYLTQHVDKEFNDIRGQYNLTISEWDHE